MKRKAQLGDIIMDNIIYLILTIVFFVGMMAFVNSRMNGGAVWEDYYAKEIVKVIDLSKPGDNVTIDVQRATEIAQKNRVASFEDIFQFDNLNGTVCVRLSLGRSSCFSYFNDVNVVMSPGEKKKWVYLAEPVNRLHFSIVEKEAKE